MEESIPGRTGVTRHAARRVGASAASPVSWVRRHPLARDAVWAVVLSPLTLLATIGIARGGTLGVSHGGALGLPVGPVTFVVGLVWGLAYTLPLLLRSTRPYLGTWVLVPAHLFQLLDVHSVVPANITVPVMMYAVARHASTRHSRIGLAVGLVGAVASGFDWGFHMTYLPNQALVDRLVRSLINFLPSAAVVLACWFAGQWVRQRELTLQSLRERADSLEREREQGIRLVAQEERNRLAREMHDIVAHSLSVVVVQADGAGYLASHAELGDAEARLAQVAKAIETIGTTARTALGETRRLVGVLRDEAEGPEMAPAATLDQIRELVDQVQQAGLPASFVEQGDPELHPPLSQGTQMAAYRVVQEALTNVLKHAGPGATVQVTLSHTADGVDVAVADTGRGATDTDGLGHGVIGMRERVTLRGGTLVARSREAGGFEVLAHLPSSPQPGEPS